MRPLFRLNLPIAREQLMDAIRTALSDDAAPVVGRVLRRHVELTVRPNAQHFWSPHLSLDVLEDDQGTLLRGRYAPHPHIWMLIMAVYSVLLLATIGACVYGCSQWLLGWTPTALWSLPLCAAGAIATWTTSTIGQALAEPQMQGLQQFLEECLRRSGAPARLEADTARSSDREQAARGRADAIT
jgi:hypothetical protein